MKNFPIYIVRQELPWHHSQTKLQVKKKEEKKMYSLWILIYAAGLWIMSFYSTLF